MTDILEESNTLKLGAMTNKKKEADAKGKEGPAAAAVDDDNPLLRAFAQTKEDDMSRSTSPVAREETQSEVASLPPSSRPSTPLSLGEEEDQSEHAEEMEEDDWQVSDMCELSSY
ncbi:hypothetical protein FRC17_004426 [Serendipita sp. 399]|nr:hypothetical protein FRC17_004426 [Serendipita sp. 399]